MKKVFITIGLLLAMSISAQETNKPTYKVVGNTIVKIDQPKKQPLKTNLTYTVNDSTYQVYQGAKGGYFIIRKSKKTGREYRMYLPTK